MEVQGGQEAFFRGIARRWHPQRRRIAPSWGLTARNVRFG